MKRIMAVIVDSKKKFKMSRFEFAEGCFYTIIYSNGSTERGFSEGLDVEKTVNRMKSCSPVKKPFIVAIEQ